MKTIKQPSSLLAKILLFSTASISATILLILITFWQASGHFLAILGELFKPQPPQPQIASSHLIVQQIQQLQELTTTTYTMQTIVPTSADRKLGDITLATTKLLYVAQGEVQAGIDLSQIVAANISQINNTLQVTLPEPKILDSKIDLQRSQVYDYDRGFLNLGPDVAPQLQTAAQQQTLQQIVTNACEQGILLTANQHAAQTIKQLLTTTGYQQVEIKTTNPSKISCVSKTES